MFLIDPLWLLITLSILCFILLLLFLVPLINGVRHAGNVAGTVAMLLLLGFFTANSFAAAWLRSVWEHSTGHIILCIIFGLLALLAFVCLYYSFRMGLKLLRKPPKPMPAIVLGCCVGKKIDNRLLDARIQTACDYLNEHPESYAVLCGGCTGSQNQSEAEYMQSRLLEKGIAKKRLLLDKVSYTTQENLTNAKQLLEEHKLGKSAVLITSSFHHYRSSVIAKELGLRTWHCTAHGPWYLIPGYWVREWFMLIRKMLFV